MTSYRLIIGIIVGIVLSFFTVFFFNMMVIIEQINLYVDDDELFRIFALLVGANFDFDMISFFTGNPTVLGFFAPELLAWIFMGYITGTIAKGLKRGVIASTLVVVIVLLMWILLNIASGEDLMSLFQGTQLTETLGGIFSAFIGVLIGGSVGGLVSGPFEEI